MPKCPICKGSGAVFVKSTDLTKTPPTETGFELTCYLCDGDGEITQASLEAHEAAEAMMCSCENPTFGSYPGDGECGCGMHKHHVHCGNCNKISQIG
jgi:hypothetical protein